MPKMWWKTSLKTFSKKLKLSMYRDQQSKVLYRLFLLYVQIESYQNILKLRCRPFASYEVFLNNKKRSGTSLTAFFCV